MKTESAFKELINEFVAWVDLEYGITGAKPAISTKVALYMLEAYLHGLNISEQKKSIQQQAPSFSADFLGDEPYFIIKDGYFYNHDSMGYVPSPLLAELFSKEYALSQAEMVGCQAVSLSSQRLSIERIDAVIERLNVMKKFIEGQKNASTD